MTRTVKLTDDSAVFTVAMVVKSITLRDPIYCRYIFSGISGISIKIFINGRLT